MAANPIVQLIVQGAKARGLDPAAVLAVASREGLSGRIGDGGHAYGPFQLNNAGGVITRSHPGTNDPGIQAWASSPAGINFALDQIAKVARGQHGRKAINSIVTGFERPANPGAEIAGAWGAYGGYSGMGQQTPPVPQTPMQPSLGQPPVRPGIDPTLFNVGNQLFGLPSLRMPPPVAPSGAAAQPVQQSPLSAPGRALSSASVIKGKTAVNVASKALGIPYVWGGTSTKGFDCSGLLQFAWAKAGVTIPRRTYEQWTAGTAVDPAHLQSGDAVFFKGSDSITKNGQVLPGHVGIYIGDGKFIEAPHTGANVRITTLKGRTDFMGARRYS